MFAAPQVLIDSGVAQAQAAEAHRVLTALNRQCRGAGFVWLMIFNAEDQP